MPSEVFVVRWSPEGKFIASGLGDGSIRVLNTETGHVHMLNVGRGRHMPVTSLRFRPLSSSSKTKNVLLAVDADGVAKHWHVTSGKCLHTIEAAGSNQLFAVDYRDDGSLFATAGSDKEVRVVVVVWAFRVCVCCVEKGVAPWRWLACRHPQPRQRLPAPVIVYSLPGLT